MRSLLVLAFLGLSTLAIGADSQLVVTWSTTLPLGGVSTADQPIAVRELADRTRIVLSRQTFSPFATARLVLTHLASDGSVVHQGPLDGMPMGNLAPVVQILADGSVLAAWSTASLMKWDGRTGRRSWPLGAASQPAGDEPALPSCLTVDGSGNVFVAGARSSAVGGPSPQAIVLDGYSGRTGDRLVHQVIPAGSTLERPGVSALVSDPWSGDLLLAGGLTAQPPIGAFYVTSWLVYQLDGAGNLRYRPATLSFAHTDPRFGGPGTSLPKSMVLDAAGSPVVSGDTIGPDSYSRMTTVALSMRTGQVLWTSNLGGSPNWASVSSLARDGDGNLVVSGSSYDESGILAKLNAASGQTIWRTATPESIGTCLLSENVAVASTRSGFSAFALLAGEPRWRVVGGAGGPGVAALRGDTLTIARADPSPPGRTAVLGVDLSTGLESRPRILVDALPFPVPTGRISTAIDPTGDVVWCGLRWGTPPVMLAGRLDPTTGLPRQAEVPLGPASLSFGTCEVAKDGTVLVSTPANGTTTVTRYDSRDGHALWGPLAVGLQSTLLHLDMAGGVLVGGDRPEAWDLARIGTGGGLLWSRPGAVPGYPLLLGISASGDPILLSSTIRGPTLYRLDASTGNALWGPRSLARPDDHVREIVTDASGDTEHLPFSSLPLPNGDILVSDSPYTYFAPGVFHLELTRLAGATGQTVWGPVAIAPNEFLALLGLGPSGECVLTSFESESQETLIVSRYSMVDGSRLEGPGRLGVAPNTNVHAMTFSTDGPVLAFGNDFTGGLARFTAGLAIASTDDDLRGATVAVPFRVPARVMNGRGPYVFAVVSGALPPSLGLDGVTGLISGTPVSIGLYPFRLQVSEVTGFTVSRDLAIQVSALDVTGIPGDLDLDSKRSIVDVVELASHIVGNLPAGTYPFLAPRSVADLDHSGTIDVLDVIHLMAVIVGNESL